MQTITHFISGGVGPTTAAHRGYTGGFATAMMLKNLKLAQGAAARYGACTPPFGAQAEALYALFDRLGCGASERRESDADR